MATAWRLREVEGSTNWSERDVAAGSGAAPSISTASLPDGDAGLDYEASITVTGDTPVTIAVTSGEFPSWASLAGETISGGPAYPGFYEFVITATNAYGSDTQTLSITVPNEMSGGGEITVSQAGEVVASESGADVFAANGGKKKSRSLLLGAG